MQRWSEAADTNNALAAGTFLLSLEWSSVPWTLWVIIVPIAFNYLRAGRERSAQRQAYERAVESDGRLTDLLPDDSRPHVGQVP